MHRLTITLLAATLLIGCQSNKPSPSATKPTEPSKTAVASKSTDAAKVSTTATNDVDTAKLAEIARAAAEGKAPATPGTPAAPTKVALPSLPATPHDKPGFATKVVDGRLWVFKADTKELADFIKAGELEKSVTRVGVGPNGMTLRGPDAATLDAYIAAGK